ncbi:MAG: hypothetical protein WDZ68_01545 [Candidatus Paceibacterota bacterium]
MTEVLHANIFFFITSVAVVLFVLLICVALYHIIKIIRSIRRIVERIEAGSETVMDDINDLRNSFNLKHFVSFIMSMIGVQNSRRRRSRRVTDDEEIE